MALETMFSIAFSYLLICGESVNFISAIPLYGQKVKIASTQEFSFVASLQKVHHVHDQYEHFCTGTLISVRDVLTSEHCIIDEQPSDIQVVFRAINNTSDNPTFNVEWMMTYDQWADQFEVPNEFAENDVAILRLSTSVSQINIQPAILGQIRTVHLYRTKAVMIGWDFEIEGVNLAKRLRKANVKILTPDDCERKLYLITNLHNFIDRNELCTAAAPYVLTNLGDSGGPLLDTDNELIGITFGSGVDQSYHWGNFSKEFMDKYEVNKHFSVEYYREFINYAMSVH